MKRKKQRRFISGLLAMLLALNVFIPVGNVQAESDTSKADALIINTEETPAPDPEEDTDIIMETKDPSEEVPVASPSVPEKVTGGTENKKQKAAAGMGTFAEVGSILTDLSAKVIQNGQDVTNDAEIDYQLPLSVEISFGIPVLGDYEDPDNPDGPFVNQWDTATFPLGEGFTILAPVTFNLVHKVGGQTTTSEL